jgi:hypothetical protein
MRWTVTASKLVLTAAADALVGRVVTKAIAEHQPTPYEGRRQGEQARA